MITVEKNRDKFSGCLLCMSSGVADYSVASEKNHFYACESCLEQLRVSLSFINIYEYKWIIKYQGEIGMTSILCQ